MYFEHLPFLSYVREKRSILFVSGAASGIRLGRLANNNGNNTDNSSKSEGLNQKVIDSPKSAPGRSLGKVENGKKNNTDTKIHPISYYSFYNLSVIIVKIL